MGTKAGLKRSAVEETVPDPIVFAGTVEWSGENPGISLKETPDGRFVALASFFRVVLSPHGRGHALVLLQSPDEATPSDERANYCLHDNEKLARYLVSDFVSKFGAYKGLIGLKNLVYRRLNSVEASGDPSSTYSERVTAGDLDVRLTWSGLGEPFCFALPPDKSATGKHHMPSLFVGCDNATIAVNGRTLSGRPVPREIAGRTITTAMLAFSETWIRTA
jgi:hypothetical protein